MKNKQFKVHYANFVCHFGADELLDYLNEIVLPAFLTPTSMRTFKDGRYFFDDVSVLNLAGPGEAPELAVCGRFIKDMVVRSEQRWDDTAGALVADARKLETAPSAIFVLLLASHKLIYLLETANAPGLGSFRTTAEHFLKGARRDYIEDLVLRNKFNQLTAEEFTRVFQLDEDGEEIPVTKKFLNEVIGAVDLEVVPLSNEESLRQFLERFQTLQVATVKLVKPNSELDNDDFLDEFRAKSDAVGSKTSSIVYRNSDGLNKGKVIGQLEVAAADANAEIRLEGKDKGGQPLRGTNDEFKLVSYLEAKPSNVRTMAQRMLTLFRSQRQQGLIKTADPDPNSLRTDLLTALAASIENSDGHPHS